MSSVTFGSIDLDGDGHIDVDEFKDWAGSRSFKKTTELIRAAVYRMAKDKWRSSDGLNDTVAHKLFTACRERNLSEEQTIELVDVSLEADASLLTIENAKSQTATDLAVMCEGKLGIQHKFTVVLFDKFQIVKPKNPLYKSPTAEVHECWNLSDMADTSTAGDRKSMVLKLMATADMWLSEVVTRDAMNRDHYLTSVVQLESAALIAASNADDTLDVAASRDHAVDYVHNRIGADLAIGIFQPHFVAETGRQEARQLMVDFPYAIEMLVADRNLNEIIISERLAEEPLEVIRQTSRQILDLVADLHRAGVVHGDLKPKNIVRVGRTLKFIDFVRC
jgi:hypothetical protein